MVETQCLEVGGASGQKICMVAICYHNLAIEYLHLKDFDAACLASQNARRIARLCLSYSNRWVGSLESTHQIALAAIGAQRLKAASKSGQLPSDQEEAFRLFNAQS